MVTLSPLLPQNIAELLPKSDEDNKVSFIAFGPRLVDALIAGEDINEASRKAGIAATDAVKLLVSPEFQRYVEAYLAIGELADKSVRIRIAKSILAAQIASGVTYKRKEPMDILEFVRRETETKRGFIGVHVQVNNNSVDRPYKVAKVVEAPATLEIPAETIREEVDNGGIEKQEAK